MSPFQQLCELIGQAGDLPHGPAKVAVLEAAVGLADAQLTPPDAYFAREPLMDAAIRAGRTDLLLAHFAWCLAAFDADPDSYNERLLLWRYKWVNSGARKFPDIRLEQLKSLLDDMERRFERYGSGRRASLLARASHAHHVGDPVALQKYQLAARKVRRDDLCDCQACEADEEVDFHLFLRQLKRAMRSAQPLLDGRLSCAEVPLRTYCRLLVPLLQMGEAAEAVRVYHAARRKITRSADVVSCHGDLLAFLAVTDNLPVALKLMTRTTSPALAFGVTPADRFDYLSAAALVLRRAAAAGSRASVKVPADHPLAGPTGSAPVAPLAEWATAEATALAGRFDARNGTDAFARRLARLADLERAVTPLTLDA